MSSILSRKALRYSFTCKRKAQLLFEKQPHDESFDYDEHTKFTIIQKVKSNSRLFEQRLNRRINDSSKHKIYFASSHEGLPDFYLKADSNSSLIIPLIVIPHFTVKPSDRQELALATLNISKAENRSVSTFGFIVFSPELKVTKVNISEQLIDKTRAHSARLQLLKSAELNPVFIKHECNNCPYFSKCYTEAKSAKHLSLLPYISEKRISELKNRGIFTWEQLSYTYRAKKKKSHTLNHIIPLRALAIRKAKVFVNEYPAIPSCKNLIFFDIEGLPHENYKYLIGLVVISNANGRITNSASYWADTQLEELTIVKQFLDFIADFKDVVFFHYGNYEIDYLKSIKNKLDDDYQSICSQVISNSFNTLSVLRTHVLFPTFSNSLKDVTDYLCFGWNSQIKTGYDSIKSRLDWQSNNCNEIKESLIEYNRLDCMALSQLTLFLKGLKQSSDIVKPNQLEKQTYNLFWRDEYATDDMQKLLAHAYFDYRKEKVSVSNSRRITKFKKQTNSGYQLQPYKPNKIIEISPKCCPKCKASLNKSKVIRELSKKVTDLKFTASGAKRWVVLYKTNKFKCACGSVFQDPTYPTQKQHIGFNVKAYIVYQYMFNRLSLAQIKKNLSELFRLKLSGASIFGYKEEVAKFYRPIYIKLLNKIIESNVIYIDETPFKLEEGTIYGWVLSNGVDVVTLYRENRSSDFLLELLEDFKGVIVSDFYSGYDRLNCKKQRCLIHLIRDINHLLLRYPDDTALKVIASNFTELLASIVKDIEDKSKSRKWYLKKFKPEIQLCQKTIVATDCHNIDTKKLQNRLIKYWHELFEFTNHNDIHWNNTVAEHAIKLIATHRNKNLKYLSIKKIEDYMTILTIYQNCEIKEKSFLRFLLNQKPEDIL
ncbi:TM0106 family RecB-like putative nuclease [Flocculibacter collagenilyticus]|uniref:TM0106 family RecB-like putative nuclease n=1 Tax=Flocculibacter collagenilyticus TaxID=2744479 RepID=UPI0018F5A5AA|nr:TM0106 family RecB-like putative nuclease [Flocculibacter collagenilyticus]